MDRTRAGRIAALLAGAAALLCLTVEGEYPRGTGNVLDIPFFLASKKKQISENIEDLEDALAPPPCGRATVKASSA